MQKYKFSLAYKVKPLLKLVKKTDHKKLAIWVIDCVKRVLLYFEKQYPKDHRPQNAIKTLQAWIKTGKFKMAIIRGASLATHAAARQVGEDNAARSAARAAGQALATAHVPTHSIAAAHYALQAIYRASDSDEVEKAVKKERGWQYKRLIELRKNKKRGLGV